MAFQAGNKLGGRRKEKLFFDAIMLEMKEQESLRGARVIARKLLDLAVSGDMQAIKEVANRLDGMPIATVESTNEHIYVVRTPEPLQPDAWKQKYQPSGNHSPDPKPH